MPSPGRLSVLCVDNQPEMLRLMRLILQRAGHTAHAATDGEAAIRLLGCSPGVDVLVVNHLMPRMTGLEVVRFVASHRCLDHVGIIFNSAAADLDLPMADAGWARVDVVLRVPFLSRDLLSAVQRAYLLRHDAPGPCGRA